MVSSQNKLARQFRYMTRLNPDIERTGIEYLTAGFCSFFGLVAAAVFAVPVVGAAQQGEWGASLAAAGCGLVFVGAAIGVVIMFLMPRTILRVRRHPNPMLIIKNPNGIDDKFLGLTPGNFSAEVTPGTGKDRMDVTLHFSNGESLKICENFELQTAWKYASQLNQFSQSQ